MTDIELRVGSEWRNFHETVRSRPAAFATLYGGHTIRSASDWFRESGVAFMDLIGKALQGGKAINSFGAAYSFSDIIGTAGIALDTVGLGAMFELQADELDDPARDPSMLALVGGGVRLRELMTWLADRDLSLETSGSYDNQSLAGSIATGVHGSALGKGGVQNHVRGIHLVTGPDSSWWIERTNDAYLSDDFARTFATGVKRNDAEFESALINLGGMGIINALLIEAVPLFYLDVIAQKKAIDQTWFDKMADGDFSWVASQFGYAREPYYYEITLNPFVHLGDFASLHTLYFPTENFPFVPRGELEGVHYLTALARLFAALAMPQKEAIALEAAPLGPQLPDDFDLPTFYADNWFTVIPSTSDDGKERTWRELVRAFVDRGGQLYSAAFALDRADIPRAYPEIMNALSGKPRHFVATIRFVTDAAGTIPFSHFSESVVIDFDGAGEALSKHPPIAIAAVRAALDAAGIPYALHWGKLGENDQALIDANFGDRATPDTKLAQWCDIRQQLLPGPLSAVFENEALRRWKMV